MHEIWKPVIGYEGLYEVSNFGRVKSLDRVQVRSNGKVICEHHIKGQILKPAMTGKLPRRYPTVCICGKGHKVHRLVAEAFIPNPNNLPQVNHIDGNKENNRIDNLEWCDNRHNVLHAIETGLFPCGEQSSSSKLTASQVLEIRTICKKGDSEFGIKPLARKYGVAPRTIASIIEERKWKHICTLK